MKRRGVGKMTLRRRRRRKKERKTSAPAAATRTTVMTRKRKGWAGADAGRAEPGKPSWSGTTPPSPTSAWLSGPAHLSLL